MLTEPAKDSTLDIPATATVKERVLGWRVRVSAATVLMLVGLGLAPTVFARITLNTIDPLAIVTDEGGDIDDAHQWLVPITLVGE